MESPSLLPLLSNDELQNFCELLSSDSLAHTSFNALPSPPYSPQPFLCSPLDPTPPFSPNRHAGALPNPGLVVGFAKRDWLSSLSQLSPSSTPSASPPSGHIPSSISSSLANSYSLIASSHSLCASTSSSTKNLQTYKELPLPSKLRHDHDLHLPKVQGSMLGANAFGVVLRLSDVKAALQAMPFESHLSHSANASPTFTLNSSNSTNPHTSMASGVNLTIHPALITSCDLTSSESLTNVDEWLHRSGTTKGQLARPNSESRWCESKNNKKTRKLENAPRKVTNQTTMLNGVMQDTRKIRIYNDRVRRQGMKYRYGILRSLLPDENQVPSSCKLSSSDLQERLIAFVRYAQITCPREESLH